MLTLGSLVPLPRPTATCAPEEDRPTLATHAGKLDTRPRPAGTRTGEGDLSCFFSNDARGLRGAWGATGERDQGKNSGATGERDRGV